MDETFMKARAYLAQNYSDPELSLTDLCHYLGFSCSYFSTLFKQKTGLNYSHYITSLRLEQAARLLTDTADVRYPQLQKNATSGTSAQRLRANAQQSAVIRLTIRSTGTASPSNGMMTESTGATFPEKAAIMVMVAKTNVAAIRQM